MYDRPTAQELLDAARTHLETHLIPAIKQDRKLYFQTLVAVNVIRIVERQMQTEEAHLRAEFARFMDLTGGDASHMPERSTLLLEALTTQNDALAEAIRAGDYDETAKRTALFEHLKATTIEQLEVANPLFLVKLLKEMNDPSLDAWANR